MKIVTKEELKEILRNHKLWLKGYPEGKRADLRWVDLAGANLQAENLRGADLRRADLRKANLQGADLRLADLRWADLREAYLRGANLQEADLRWADLQKTDLQEADIRWTNIQWADLREADLQGADLDYSCLPLLPGSLSAQFDDRQLIQIAYYLVKAGLESKNASEKTKKELEKLKDFANQFHRITECGKIK